jgi:hypothetical protein
VSATPDERTPTPERKETEIRDLPDKQPGDDAASDVKGGTTSAIIPCFRVPKVLKPIDPTMDPCIRTGLG